jgi:hypothetical protein
MVVSPKGLEPEKDCTDEGQQHIQKQTRHFVREGTPEKQDTKLSKRNKYLVMSPWLIYWLTVSCNVTLSWFSYLVKQMILCYIVKVQNLVRTASLLIFYNLFRYSGARGSVFGWGTMLNAGRSSVRMRWIFQFT